jgi:S-adenosyl methyltransferase
VAEASPSSAGSTATVVPVGDGGATGSRDYAAQGDPPPPPDIDVSVAHPARIYDYLLGGKDNYAADRAVADQMLVINPGAAGAVAAELTRARREYQQRATQGLTFRTRPEVAAFFAGFDLVDPGLVDPASWRPTQVPPTETEGSRHLLVGVGVLPKA